MDERRANIDLAFRNGLKDYEVLPPPGVWNNIDSRLQNRVRPLYFLRAAAFLAIAMTMSVLAYRWTGKTPVANNNSSLVLNQESSSPLNIFERPSIVLKGRKKSGSRVTNTIASEPIAAAVPAMPEKEETIAVIFRMPATNLAIPQNLSTFSIIHHQTGLNTTQTNPLVIDNVSKEYHDYLSANLPADNYVPKKPRWSISALATPTYYGNINTGSDELSKQIASSEQAVVSYTGGVALAYNLNKRLSIQSGLFYSSVGEELEGINSFAGFQKYDVTKGDHNFEVLTSNGTVTTNNADVFLLAQGNGNRIITVYNRDVFDPQKASLTYINNTIRQSFSYLELPVFLRYKVIDRAVDFNLIGGLSYNLLVNNSVYTVVDGNKYMIGTTDGLNMFSISSSLGMGMEYDFSDKFSLNLEPTFRYYLNTFNNAAGSQFHPFSFGIFSGVTFKF